MKKNLFLLLLVCFSLKAAANNIITVCSWNLENFGKSKNENTIEFIANTLKDFDVIAIVEVVAGNGVAQAVARLSDALNRKGTKWDYTISDPTTGTPNKKERYAFIWKTSKLTKVGKAWLESKYENEIEREPYLVTFKSQAKEFTIATFHALPKTQQPEKEIKYLQFLPEEYSGKTLLICGDFNCPQSNSVFSPLKSLGYKPILVGQKTSLKQKCINNDCLSAEYDNLFYDSQKILFMKSGIVPFYSSFLDLKEARHVSDHVPIFFQFSLN